MSNNIETLLLRNLQEVFGEGDPERRRSAIEQPQLRQHRITRGLIGRSTRRRLNKRRR